MAQLPRKFQRIFAETAGTDEVGVVGSRASGTPATSKDLDVIQSNNRFIQGWFLTTIRQTLTGGVQADLPASEDFNGLLFLLTSQLQYLFQNGIPEWLDDANQRYYENISFVQVNGDVYQAIQGDDGANINAQQNPTTSPDWWRLIWSRTSTAFYRAIVGAETINLTAGTPPRFIEVTGGTPFTLTLNGFVSPPGSPLVIYNNTAGTLTIAGSSGLSEIVTAGGVLTTVSNDSTMIRQVSMTDAGQQVLEEQNANDILRLSAITDIILPTTIWSERQTLDGNVQSLTFGNDLYVAGTNADSVWTSPDGITWINRQTLDADVGSLTFGNDLFVAGTSFGGTSVWTSSNGTTWTERQTLDNAVGALTFGNNLFVAGTAAFSIWTSTDGITWIERQDLDGIVNALTFGNNLFVAGTVNGNSVWTSSDGITWTERQTLDGSVLALTASDNLFVAGTGANTIWTSPDGITWTNQQTLDADIIDLAFGGSLYVAGTSVGGDSIWTSTDGATWAERQQLGDNVNSLTFGNRGFVAGTGGVSAGASTIWTPGV